MTGSNHIDTYVHPIVFYDGVCGLCNRSVQFILRHDKKKKFRFATLQGEVAKEMLSPEQRERIDTVIVRSRDRMFQKSGAFFEIMANLGGWPSYFLAFSWLPSKFTDWLYMHVARRRYKWFEQLASCPVPEPGVRERFLDEHGV